MILRRVLLSLRSNTCPHSICLQRIYPVNVLSGQKLSLISSSSHLQQVSSVLHISPSAHQLRPKAVAQSFLPLLTMSDMQPGCISYGGESTVIVPDDDEDEEGGERVVGQEDMGTVVMTTSSQVDAARMKVREGVPDTSECTPTASNVKATKRKMKRERRKLMKKKLKSADTSDNFMSELPFALTSPTTWKALGFPDPESTQAKRKRKRGDSGGRLDSEEDGDKKKKKKENQRPNYFVSIPITNTQISSAVSEVQEAVLQQEPRLAKAMIPIPTLHITLLVTHLANQEQVDLASDKSRSTQEKGLLVEKVPAVTRRAHRRTVLSSNQHPDPCRSRAATVLAQVEPSLAELLGGRDLVLPFSGISHFRKEVVFVGLATGQHRHTLDSVAELLRSRFDEQGLLQGDCRGFEPHLTIMKLSRASKLRSQGIKRVDPALYSNYSNKFFGDQTVERVDLCSMLKKKQQDGYYHTETSLQLDLQSPLHAKRSSGRRRPEPDEAELLRVSKRLVEDAVNRALQQYKQETLQNGGGPNTVGVQPPGNTEETATKTDTTANSTTDNRK